jgi:hypothetical protein
MARKPLLPDMDKKALEELAQQFPSTSGPRVAAISDPTVEAAPADVAPVPEEPAAAAADPVPTMMAGAITPPPRDAEPEAPASVHPLLVPPSPAAGPASPRASAESTTIAATDATVPCATRAWHEEPRLRSAAIGAVAFLAGYAIGQPGSVGENPLPAAVAQAVEATRREASDEIDQLRARAAATLSDAEQRAADAIAAAREQSAAETRAARTEANRATAELAAFRAQRIEVDRIIATATAIAAAAEAGRGFSNELATARQQAGDAPRLAAAIESLVAFAAGVPSRTMLAEAFEPATRRALSLGEDVAPSSWFDRFIARFTGGAAAEQAVRTAAVNGARTEMGRGDLVGAVEALSRLDDVARPAVGPWMSAARDRIALDAAVGQATAALVLLAARTP